MMGYLDRLKGAVSEKHALTVLQKLQKAPFDSFSSTQGGHVAEIEAPAALWVRVVITEPGGRIVEVDTPPAGSSPTGKPTPSATTALGCAVKAVLPLPKPRAPADLVGALRAACEGVAGITPAEFRSLLSPEDVADLEAGAIHPKTLRVYAQSFAEGIRSGRVVVLGERTPSP